MQTILFIIIWDFLTVEQTFLSPQMKRSMIISNKHGIYMLPHDLKKDLRMRILGNQEISGKSQNFIELLPNVWSPSRNGNLVSTIKNLLKNRNLTFPVVLHFTWELEFVSNILTSIFCRNSFLLLTRSQTTSILI